MEFDGTIDSVSIKRFRFNILVDYLPMLIIEVLSEWFWEDVPMNPFSLLDWSNPSTPPSSHSF